MQKPLQELSELSQFIEMVRESKNHVFDSANRLLSFVSRHFNSLLKANDNSPYKCQKNSFIFNMKGRMEGNMVEVRISTRTSTRTSTSACVGARALVGTREARAFGGAMTLISYDEEILFIRVIICPFFTRVL
jgi:hypothetical protein